MDLTGMLQEIEAFIQRTDLTVDQRICELDVLMRRITSLDAGTFRQVCESMGLKWMEKYQGHQSWRLRCLIEQRQKALQERKQDGCK